MSVPDGVKVRILAWYDFSNWQFRALHNYGAIGDIIVLSTSVAKELIAKGWAELVE